MKEYLLGRNKCFGEEEIGKFDRLRIVINAKPTDCENRGCFEHCDPDFGCKEGLISFDLYLSDVMKSNGISMDIYGVNYDQEEHML